MSQYIEFYIKAGEKYAPIYTCSRSGQIFQAFMDHVPYEHAAPMTSNILSDVKQEQKAEEVQIQKQIDSICEKMEWLKTSNLPAEELLQAYDDAREMLDYYKDELAQRQRVYDFCNFIDEIIDEVRYLPETCKYLGVDPDNYVYCGIECGNPGFKDLEE